MRKKPRYNVVSLRVTDEDRDTLDEVARITNRNVSQIMREAMLLLQNKLAQENGIPYQIPKVARAARQRH